MKLSLKVIYENLDFLNLTIKELRYIGIKI